MNVGELKRKNIYFGGEAVIKQPRFLSIKCFVSHDPRKACFGSNLGGFSS